MTTDKLIDQIKSLMTIPSTADNLPALQQATDFIFQILDKHPEITTERFERNGKPSLLAYRAGSRPKEFDILLNGHVDVVPATPDLFEPKIKNGRLYGRGSLDMKGTTLMLVGAFCDRIQSAPYHLGLQIVSDEEIGGYDGAKLQIDQGVRAKFVLVGEYSNDRNTIYNAARGLCWVELGFKGKSAHGGHLWNGSNAVIKASEFYTKLLEHYPLPKKETWTTTASIASLNTSNETYNKVPDSAVLKIDFRFIRDDPIFQNERSLREFIARIDPKAELLDVASFEPGVHVAEANPYVQGLFAATQKVTKVRPHFLGRPGASDGRHFAIYGSDVIEFGLYGKNSHSDGEYVELSSFAEYRAVLREFLRQPTPASRLIKSPAHHRVRSSSRTPRQEPLGQLTR